jgi:arylsulfatase A-like enzyme
MSQKDLISTLIIKGGADPRPREQKLVRTIDVVPTILDICFDEKIWDADGQSLNEGYSSQPAYSEELFEKRGAGALQAIQDERFKMIRNNTTHLEEFYDLRSDPDETTNLIGKKEYKGNIDVCRKKLDEHLNPGSSPFKPEDEKAVIEKLKELGYI